MTETMIKPQTLEQEFAQLTKPRTLDQLKSNTPSTAEKITSTDYVNLAERATLSIPKSSLEGLRKEVKTDPSVTTVEEIKLGFFINNTSYEVVKKELEALSGQLETMPNLTQDDKNKVQNVKKHITACNEYLVELEVSTHLHNGGKSMENKQPTLLDKLFTRVEKITNQFSNKK
jgi:hypothetical protein